MTTADELFDRMYGSQGLREGAARRVTYSREEKPPPMPDGFTDVRSDPGYVHRDRTKPETLGYRLPTIPTLAPYSVSFTLKLDPEAWDRAMENVRLSIERMSQQIAAVSARWAPVMETWAKFLPEPLPTEPKARALALRRNRNNGPDNRPSLDGRRRAKR